MTPRWYVVHVYSGFENKVAEAIREKARKQGLEDHIQEILVPMEEIVEVRRGQRVNAERKFFPGYVLAKLVMDDDIWHLIKNTPKVSGFLGAGGNKPVAISEAEAQHILRQDNVRSGRERQSGRRPVRVVQRRGRGNRRREGQTQGFGLDLWPCDPRRAGIQPGREDLITYVKMRRAVRSGALKLNRGRSSGKTRQPEPHHKPLNRRKTWQRK